MMQRQRQRMVSRQLEGRGIKDAAVLAAMRMVPREEFVDERYREFAYDDGPLPILEGQTISQPYVVALMIESLRLEPGHRVLEIGTGSGYAAAVISRIAAEVFTIERFQALAVAAGQNLARLAYDNIHIKHGDGTMGWPEHAPYDAIIVAAGGPKVPPALKEQLAIGGRLVMPVGREQRSQRLVTVTRLGAKKYDRDAFSHVRFVPLIGEQGWEREEQGRRDFF